MILFADDSLQSTRFFRRRLHKFAVAAAVDDEFPSFCSSCCCCCQASTEPHLEKPTPPPQSDSLSVVGQSTRLHDFLFVITHRLLWCSFHFLLFSFDGEEVHLSLSLEILSAFHHHHFFSASAADVSQSVSYFQCLEGDKVLAPVECHVKQMILPGSNRGQMKNRTRTSEILELINKQML